MHASFSTLMVCGVLMLLSGCSKRASTQARPLVVLAMNERGAPQLDYSGPGVLNYRYSLGSFSFEIGPVSGAPWIIAKGEAKRGASNDVVFSIASSSDRAYDIQLLGVSTNNTDLPEERTRETMSVPASNQTLSVHRFVIYTYDFVKR